MDWESRKYIWLGVVAVAALLLMYAALQANRLAVNAIKQKQKDGRSPVPSVTATNRPSGR